MSHPHEVPKGWERGEPLTGWQASSRWALAQASATLLEIGKVLPDDVAVITFDSKDDMRAFLRWWHEGKSPEQIMEELAAANESWRAIFSKAL